MMNLSRLTAAVAVAASLVAAGAAAAQGAPAAQATPAGPDAKAALEQVGQYDDWAIRCFPIKAPAPCEMFQMDIDKKTQRRVSAISIAYAPGPNVYALQIVVPLGVALEHQLRIVAGQFESPPLPFRRCENDGCYVEGRMDQTFFDRLASQSGGAAVVVQAMNGKTFRFPLSLRGMAPALARLKAEASKRASGSAAKG